MDKFEKQLVSHDNKRINDRKMDALIKDTNKGMREEGKYYKAYKDKVIELRM